MAHFGVLSYKGTGHMNPFISLSKRLKSKGHRVTFFQTFEVEGSVRQAGMDFFPIGKDASLSNDPDEANDTQHIHSSIFSLRADVRCVIADMERSLREIPSALDKSEVDVLLIDEIVLSGPTLAQMLHLPYFVISTSVPHRFGWSVPTYFPADKYPIAPFDEVKNALLQASVFCVDGPIRHRLDSFRRSIGLEPIREIQRQYPELAHITQLPQCLDLPQSRLPNNFYYAGPFVDKAARPSVDFPWDDLDGRPLVYASLGTRKNSQPAIFYAISEACRQLGLQLVISLGGQLAPEMLGSLPGQPLVVRYAPQLDLLKRAEVVITHGGLNTALETLMEGKPMVVLPMTHDQPAVAARLSRLKIAEVLSIKDLSAEELRTALSKLLDDTSYRDAAMDLRGEILSSPGLEGAVQVIEKNLERYAANRALAQYANDRKVTSQ